MKRSRVVRLTLSGTIAASLSFAGCSKSSSDDSADLSSSASDIDASTWISEDQAITNNAYLSGAGYYHAPFQGWYTHPLNTYWPGRGYYYGGDWWPTPFRGSLAPARPLSSAVSLANTLHAAQLGIRPNSGETTESDSNNGGSGVRSGSGSGGGSGFSTTGSGGTSSGTGGRSGIVRGGFGGSHAGGSSGA